MNYVCNFGKCECNTDTFYESVSKGCGKYSWNQHQIKKLNN
jgi:hypothetical protein